MERDVLKARDFYPVVRSGLSVEPHLLCSGVFP